MLALMGFLIIVIIMVLLLKSKTTPTVAFIVVPTVLALCAGFSIQKVGSFVKTGVADTAEMAALFIFSITFFGIMSDAGMFDRIINALVKRAGNSVVSVAVLTSIIAMLAHLDGSGAATFLITIPAMLPIFKRLHMRNTSLLLICTAAMGVMNLLPWGGPTVRAATVIKMDSTLLWHRLIPMQVVGLIAALVVAVIVGLQEVKRGAGLRTTDNVQEDSAAVLQQQTNTAVQGKEDYSRPQFFWFNLFLTLAVILVLMFIKLPTFYPFMIGTAIALIVNYHGTKLQEKIVKTHASAAVMMASTLLGAGVMLGVLQKSGMMDAMANVLVKIIPASFGPYIAIVFGVLSAPLALAFSTDSYYYGVLPIVIGVAQKFGVAPVSVAITMVACRNCACFISPMVPATFLGCGLAEVDINEHIKRSFFWVWGISLVMLVSGILLGVIPLGA